MPHCSVPGCNNDSRKAKCATLSWFRYPTDIHLKRQWLERVRRANFSPTRESRVCSMHFGDDCFERDMSFLDSFVASGELDASLASRRRRGKRLKPGAVPSIFPSRQAPSRRRSSVYLDKKEKEAQEVSVYLGLLRSTYVLSLHLSFLTLSCRLSTCFHSRRRLTSTLIAIVTKGKTAVHRQNPRTFILLSSKST